MYSTRSRVEGLLPQEIFDFYSVCRKRILVWPKAGVVPRDLKKRVRREEKGFKAKGKRYSMVPYMDVGINDKTLK
jgi:hypothetical protein